MASLHASVRQLNGKVAVMDLRNPEQLQTIKKWLLEKPGFVVLKRTTEIKAAWVGAVQDECANNSVRAILEAFHPFNEYIIGHHECRYIGPEQKQTGQNEYHERDKYIVLGIAAEHLGGPTIQQWHVAADRGELGKVTKDMGIIELQGRDIFICNTRLYRSSPQPVLVPKEVINFIRIGYVWEAKRQGVTPVDDSLELGENDNMGRRPNRGSSS